MSFEILAVSWHDERAVALRKAMDDEIGPRYADRFEDRGPEESERRATAFAIDPADIVATFIAQVDGVRVAHAALRKLGEDYELKRLVTLPEYRGRGLSRALIAAVETEAASRGALRLILQTGDRQPEAVRLYEYLGYRKIPVFEPYTVFAASNCYERPLGDPVAR